MEKLLVYLAPAQRATVKTMERYGLTPEWGIETDAHGGNWHRQVSLLSAEKIENFRAEDLVGLRCLWRESGGGGPRLPQSARDQLLCHRGRGAEMTRDRQRVQSNDCVISGRRPRVHRAPRVACLPGQVGGEIHVGDEVTLLLPLENPPGNAAVITLSDKGSRRA